MMDKEELQQRLHPESERERRLNTFWKKWGVAVKIGAGTVLILLILVSCAMLRTPTKEEAAQPPTACINDVCLELEIVRSQEAQNIGLSNHSTLPEGQAMLFEFAQPDVQGIWMKDMEFPIDIFWLDQKGRIVHIEKNAQPCTPPLCEIYEPQTLVKYVLETNSGFANEMNLFDGKKFELKNLKNG